MTDKLKESKIPEYDSNPFTLSFKGFGLLIDYAKGVFIAMLIFGFLGIFMNVLSYIPNTSNSDSATIIDKPIYPSDSETSSIDWAVVGGIATLAVGVTVVVIAISVLISAAYKGFIAAGANAAIERRKITAGEAFSEMGTRFSTLFSAELSITLRVIGGYLLFIIPGIRAQLRYQSTSFIVMSNKDITASDAVKSSKNLYRNHLMEAFGISTVGGIIPIIGGALAASGMALSVKQLTIYDKQAIATPKTHALNYLGLIFIGFIFVFAVLIGLLVALAAN